LMVKERQRVLYSLGKMISRETARADGSVEAARPRFVAACVALKAESSPTTLPSLLATMAIEGEEPMHWRRCYDSNGQGPMPAALGRVRSLRASAERRVHARFILRCRALRLPERELGSSDLRRAQQPPCSWIMTHTAVDTRSSRLAPPPEHEWGEVETSLAPLWDDHTGVGAQAASPSQKATFSRTSHPERHFGRPDNALSRSDQGRRRAASLGEVLF